jgi:hypothetical protein
VIVAVHAAPPEPDLADSTGTSTGLAEFTEQRTAAGTPVVVVSFGSPWVLDRFPSADAWLVAWDGVDVSQRAAARALRGAIPITGRLPVALPPDHEVGEGIVRPGPDRDRQPRETAP